MINIFTLIICLNWLSIYTGNIDYNIWKQIQTTSYANDTETFDEYMLEGNCQTFLNSCLNIPTMPTGKQLHTAIIYSTYNATQANQMCPDDYCGPLCLTTSPDCLINDLEKFNYTMPDTSEGLVNFNGPSTTQCPDECCYPNNEYCFRMYDNTGNLIKTGQEIMLVFGGITQREVLINGVNIADNCTIAANFLLSQNLTDFSNTLYLINNCGYEILNELWAYNIANNNWTYIKPYINVSDSNIIQKPQPRYGHSSVYVELVDTSASPNILRKYIYVFGGFSIYCEKLCNDMWIYEIAYAPQRYYPEQSNQWNRGNYWQTIEPSSSATPGKRMFHSMVVNSNYTSIYLFGGISIGPNGQYILNNDLWKYDIELNQWQQIYTQGIYQILRPITYWDGTTDNINISPRYYNSNSDRYVFTAENSTIFIPNMPLKRCSHSMEITIINNQEFIHIFGGYTWETVENYNLQSQLNDIWVYSLEDNTWLQIFQTSGSVPVSRHGANIRWINSEMLLLFGGTDSNGVINDLWLFSINSHQWTEIIMTNSSATNWPVPVKYSTLQKYSDGLILYGGSFLAMGNTMQNYTIFSGLSRLFYILNDMWMLNANYCADNCNQRGQCNYSRCICDPGFYGTYCENTNCPNSLCFYDLDTWSTQECFHCSNNGACVNGICQCTDGWLGDDCSIKDCLNKCSSGIDPNIGKCVTVDPVSQCACNQTLKRGGDDCSVVFCLNDCGDNGVCNYTKGICNCNLEYYGMDCSVKVLNLSSSVQMLRMNKYFLFALLYFIIK